VGSHIPGLRESSGSRIYNLIDFQPDLDDADRLTITEQLTVLSQPQVSDERRVEAGRLIKRLAPKAWEAMLPVLQSVLSCLLARWKPTTAHNRYRGLHAFFKWAMDGVRAPPAARATGRRGPG
jgi:hypothetical protein